jgi:hypothetical protein
LGEERPSGATRSILRRFDQLSVFEQEPDSALLLLHQKAAASADYVESEYIGRGLHSCLAQAGYLIPPKADFPESQHRCGQGSKSNLGG